MIISFQCLLLTALGNSVLHSLRCSYTRAPIHLEHQLLWCPCPGTWMSPFPASTLFTMVSFPPGVSLQFSSRSVLQAPMISFNALTASRGPRRINPAASPGCSGCSRRGYTAPWVGLLSECTSDELRKRVAPSILLHTHKCFCGH